MINKQDYERYLNYIEHYWDSIICYLPKDKQLFLGLPNKFVSPSASVIFKNDQFYWDSYFTIVGLVACNRIDLAKGMVDNLCYLFNRFGIIPMRNRYYNLGTSQIPFLTSMIMEVYGKDKDKSWLQKTTGVAEIELQNYWMNEDLTEKHIGYKGLSRYCDHYITHMGAEHESGWDMTSRFKNRCLDFLPVDLNSCLYKYETDLSEICRILKDDKKSDYFAKQAEARKQAMNAVMWNKKSGFFFDFNSISKRRSNFVSVAGFYPLWAGLATPEQAFIIRNKVLHVLEYNGGIVNTQATGLSKEIKQHDYPNGWPGQQWVVIKGLLNYGYKEDAERIARKWLDLNAKIFDETGSFWEKYDVVNCGIGIYNPERYKTASGFAWTNAVFVRLIEEFAG
jgi:alpha,alpha-trehalase